MQEKEFLQKVMQDQQLQQQFKALNAKGDQKGIEHLAKSLGFDCNCSEIINEMQKLDEQELNLIGGFQPTNAEGIPLTRLEDERQQQ